MSEILAPTQCPECFGPIVEFTEEKSEITTHWCENSACPGRIRDMLTFVADRTILEIEGLGPESAEILARGQFVTNLADLFEWSNELREAFDRHGVEKVSEHVRRKYGLSGAAVIRMVDTLDRAKTATWDRWIAALGIPSIGLRLGKEIAKGRNLLQDDMEQLAWRIHMGEGAPEIEGIGFHKKAEINRYCEDLQFQDMCRRLKAAGVLPTPVNKPAVVEGAPLAGIAFCITGEFYEIGSREFITAQLVKLGAVSKSGVTKKCTHLLVGTEPGRSKLTKAAELKIPQLDADWLNETLVKYGVKSSAALEVDWV